MKISELPKGINLKELRERLKEEFRYDNIATEQCEKRLEQIRNKMEGI